MAYVTWPKWPPCLYMVKTFKNLLFWNQKGDDLESWYAALVTQVLPNLLKWWPWVDLDLFYSKVKFGPFCLNAEAVDWSLCGEYRCTYSQINECMMVYDNPRSRSFNDLCPRSLRYILKLLFLKKKNSRSFEATFHMEPPWDVGMKIQVTWPRWHPVPYMINILKNLFLRNQETDDLETWHTHRVLKYYQICSNDDTGLTLTIFMTWPNLFPNASA